MIDSMNGASDPNNRGVSLIKVVGADLQRPRSMIVQSNQGRDRGLSSQIESSNSQVNNLPSHQNKDDLVPMSTRRALTIINKQDDNSRPQGDLGLLNIREDIDAQINNFSSPSPSTMKRKKSSDKAHKKKNESNGAGANHRSQQNNQEQQERSFFDRCLMKLSCRKNKEGQDGVAEHQDMRHIQVQADQCPENLKFLSNSITTTKYTIWSFLPLSIMIQFMRLSNCYFLATGILTAIPGFSPISPASTFAPLGFVIFMSVLREAYEDFKRRMNDKLTNNSPCRILREKNHFQDCSVSAHVSSPGRESVHTKEDAAVLKNNFQVCRWEEVKCGDLIYLEEGDHFPADMILLMSSEENGECFVQTSSLDGERALKHKQCMNPIRTAIEDNGLNNFVCSIHCEAPTKNLYEFSGYLESDQFPEKGTVVLESGKRTLTVDNKQLALRGSNLANTNWAIGVAVYTGRDTKLMLNYGLSRYKQSRVEKVVNIICIYLVIAQAILCLIMSVSSGFYVSANAELSADGLRRKAEYIFFTEISTFGRSENGTATDSQSIGYNPTKEAVMTYGMYFILLNTLIPLSLVVSIEFIKLAQTPFMQSDIHMYDEQSCKQCQPMSMTLHEEMAQIKYIFADKTGTLTANIMQFKACTIGSVCYDEDYRDEDYDYVMGESSDAARNSQILSPGIEEEKQDFAHLTQRSGAEGNHRLTVIQEKIIEEDDIRLSIQEEGTFSNAAAFERFKKDLKEHFNEQGKESKINRRRNSITKIVWNFAEAEKIIRNLFEKKRYFLNEETNLGRSSKKSPCLIMHKQNEYLHQFWLTVILCHDVITSLNYQTGLLAYQGTSPDEITLLDAAKEVGYQFLDRNSETMKVDIFGKDKTYKLLQKFEFTSDRKKMSVVIQDETTGMIILYSKGADLAIFDRLSTSIEQHFLEATKEDLIKFSTKGYRTLCFAMRVLDETYFLDWQHRFEAAKVELMKHGVSKKTQEPKSKFDPSQILSTLQNELEDGLFLLGATALEDKLQDGVPEAIEDFNNAGMKVWMLTGDKLETAENIGFSSGMFNEKMFIFKLQTQDKHSTRKRLEQIDQKILELEKQHALPVIGTQFILNPNAATEYEPRNILRALEEFKHESRGSEYNLSENWIRKPALRRKVRKRLEEIVPDKNAIAERLIRENQVFQKSVQEQMEYIPKSFDMNANQYIVNRTNIFRSATSQRLKQLDKQKGCLNFGLGSENENQTIDNEDKYGILVEGHTLAYIIDSKSMTERFLKILGQCQAVVVCRASPSQKAQVVQLIKDSDPDAVTLAIGDGANDVNMIQRAHIGIGIFGKEGYQAAGNSDYAIGQFRFLRRLLFVHGRWSGIRLSLFMLIFFNKNIVYTLTQFWFGWNCGFSGQSYFDEYYMSGFNIFATNFAVCALAVWDIDINVDDPKKKKIYDLFIPQIYKHSQENELFTTKKFFAWSAVSILQSLFMYGIPQLTYGDYIFSGGKKQDFFAQNVCAYFAIVIQHYITTSFFTSNWTWWIFFIYALSVALFAPFQIVTYDNVDIGQVIYKRLQEIVFQDYQFWLSILLALGISLAPVIFYFQARQLLFPSIKDIILQEALNQDQILDEADPKKVKGAMDMIKEQQQKALADWEANYNNFKQPLNKSPTQQEPGVPHNNMHTRDSNLQTPNKLLMTTPGKIRTARFAQGGEEVKTREEAIMPFQHGEIEDGENHQDLTPMRQSQSRRKGKLKHSASAAFSQEMGLVLRKVNSEHPGPIKLAEKLIVEEQPLRISRKEVGRSSNKKNNSERHQGSPDIEKGGHRPSRPFSARSSSMGYRIDDDDDLEDDSQFGKSNLELKMQGIALAENLKPPFSQLNNMSNDKHTQKLA